MTDTERAQTLAMALRVPDGLKHPAHQKIIDALAASRQETIEECAKVVDELAATFERNSHSMILTDSLFRQSLIIEGVWHAAQAVRSLNRKELP